ncbi:glycosyltransferase [Chromatocurvus halotolerans]|uniref:Glycosyl transferase family 1 domain-containing protein n=1 Tax=Chromatocurvus halotolerans TaxID=1132028 RepID=A0A4R2KTA0_9GAMM|nr:glycosyltransferase [Chromatocurvus halotolerans]TCO74306.1 hypothetical protein EV688_11419 [Chromatocurvus halotolerans]
MRVAILYYPMLFQRTGGLQVQVRETTKALQAIGVNAELFDYGKHKLTDFNIAHVFSPINGNHRIVEQAKNDGLKVVLSTVLHPPWSRFQNKRADFSSRLAERLSGWSQSSTHQHIHSALTLSDAVIALGVAERDMLMSGYRTPRPKLHIVPNGIKEAFFSANEEIFRQHFGITGKYALNVASVSPYKNQMTALQALKGKVPLVVIGPCAKENHAYLKEMQDFGGEWFRYLGVLDNDDPALPSAYAGASLFILPSLSEVQPISALEALAANCPVIITNNHSLDMLAGQEMLKETSPTDVQAISNAASTFLSMNIESHEISTQVSTLTWKKAAYKIQNIYLNLGGQVTEGPEKSPQAIQD